MKLPVLSITGEKGKELELPEQFDEVVREDLIHRAVLAMQRNNAQAYGASFKAGNKYSSYTSKRRRAYRGTYGFGISRTPRKILTRRGRRMYWVGATAPNTVGGRRAHPPKPEKVLSRSINTKERRKALRSAIAATVDRGLVLARGHKAPQKYPFIVKDELCKLEKTKELVDKLEKLGFSEELLRTQERKVRPGKGKLRGRRYKSKKAMLFIVKEKCGLQLAANNLLGVDIATVDKLNIELLAPGAAPGRLTIWTEGAVEELEKRRLYL
jgi:large subunit ribosomal protein L4e